MTEKLNFNAGGSWLGLGAGLLVITNGCTTYAVPPNAGNVYVEPMVVFIDQDDHVYYPRYQMYYGSRSHRFYSRDGHGWVAQPGPRGVLAASPSVTVDFHEGLAGHHPQVIRTYPKNWKSSTENPGHQKSHGENHEKN